MPKMIRDRLTALGVKRITKPGFHADGGGLYLRIEDGRRLWVFRFTWQAKRVWHVIGPERDIALADAREQARLCRLMVRDGINPTEARRTSKEAQRAEAGQTFEATARRYITAHEARWRSSKHAADWLNSLTMYAFPVIGAKPVASIAIADVLASLEPIWRDKPETAARVRGRIEAILGYATAMHWRDGPNPAAWQGNLKHLLPPKADIAPVKHFSALPYDKLPATMTALAGANGFGALALRFLILTASRSNETRAAKWDEIDLDARIWTIPASRTKSARAHRVPLSDAAIAVLAAMKPLQRAPAGLIFPGAKVSRPLSDVALSKALAAVAGPGFTVHGCRSSFRDWCAEQTSYPREVAEIALSHINSDRTEAAYQRGDLLDKRRRLMQDWSDYLSRPAAGGVVPIRGRV
jgi:integrase